MSNHDRDDDHPAHTRGTTNDPEQATNTPMPRKAPVRAAPTPPDDDDNGKPTGPGTTADRNQANRT
ncbi:hypothetical protein E2L08_01700 [Palleronia sediminis]|uniref:Uncharacterized protein n=1 Tax=Palleronia sediminis TaxID=2547833 RepID=A0A4R6ALA2_9RHOB|nr:hypothetical protein [Palleronia sediminis]TDL84205.1 hypothetical protein E2L08_01700 [Palleronia sediminis]